MNTKILSASLMVGVLLASCNSTKNAANDLATSLPIETSINLSNITNDKAPVTINPGRFTVSTVTYRLPRVIPGTYSVSNFGKYVDDFKAIDYNGNEMKVTKVDINSWSIDNAKKLDNKVASELSAKYSLVVGLAYELNEMYTDTGIDKTFREGLNNTIRFSFDNFEPEMVVFLFRTVMKDYNIKFNVRTDLDKELRDTFSKRYIKYIV